MNLTNTFVVVVGLFLLTACATTTNSSSYLYSGESNAGPLLKNDTLTMLRTFVKAQGCDSIDHVNTKVEFHEESNGTKGHNWGKENWTVSGCSKTFPFGITFTEDGVGGTYFSISIKK